MWTDVPGRFSPGTRVFLAPPDFTGAPVEARAITVRSSWLPHGKNQGRVVLGFDAVDTIDDAEPLAGLAVLIPASERAALTDGSLYVDTLVGCTVLDRATALGAVVDVQFPTSPDGRRRLEDAAPLLVVEHASGELLIPFATQLLDRIDLDHRQIHMRLPEGLLDLNPPASAKAQKRSANPIDTIG